MAMDKDQVETWVNHPISRSMLTSYRNLLDQELKKLIQRCSASTDPDVRTTVAEYLFTRKQCDLLEKGPV